MNQISKMRGFTLIELMVALVIAAILTAIAVPAYQEYARRTRAAQAQQEIQRLAILLDRWKARNFNYNGFSITSSYVASTYPYTVSVYDSTSTSSSKVLLSTRTGGGQGWAIQAFTEDDKNYNFLLTSTGVRCKNKTKANISYTSCGIGSESW
ncbi:type IV pilin protein [Acinetobacter sp. ME22]|uniref:type IV pilin protein n=1 Tax=Acinetobacter sp. ME22 TaxID=2904802 RepID=UPI0022AB15B0|nr:prepilin-type N-terminal cleavage/methylation domain-containing protein [Acinetobacter sp. ME22]